MKILSDDEFFEGMLGGFSFLVANYFFKKQEMNKGNILVVIILSWACFWYIRKVGMNLYRQHKKDNNISDKSLNIPLPGKSAKILVILTMLIMIYLLFIKGKKIPYKKIYRFSIRDLGLLLFLFIIGFFLNP